MTPEKLNLGNDLQTDIRQLEDDKSKFKAAIGLFEKGDSYGNNKYTTISINTRFLSKSQVLEYINNINDLIQQKQAEFNNL